MLPLGALLAQLTPGMLEPLPFSTCVLMSRELLAVPGVLVLLSLLQPELISLPAEQINASCVVGLLSLLPLVSSPLELLPATGVLASPPFVRGIVIDTPITLLVALSNSGKGRLIAAACESSSSQCTRKSIARDSGGMLVLLNQTSMASACN